MKKAILYGKPATGKTTVGAPLLRSLGFEVEETNEDVAYDDVPPGTWLFEMNRRGQLVLHTDAGGISPC